LNHFCQLNIKRCKLSIPTKNESITHRHRLSSNAAIPNHIAKFFNITFTMQMQTSRLCHKGIYGKTFPKANTPASLLAARGIGRSPHWLEIT